MFTSRKIFLGGAMDTFFLHEDTVDADISFQQCETRQGRGGGNSSMSKGRPKSTGMWDISIILVSNQYYSF